MDDGSSENKKLREPALLPENPHHFPTERERTHGQLLNIEGKNIGLSIYESLDSNLTWYADYSRAWVHCLA